MLITTITGVCESCGMFQTNKKFAMLDQKDNAACNFVVCNSCFLRYNGLSDELGKFLDKTNTVPDVDIDYQFKTKD